jgi:hypothetical protein
MGKRDVTSVNNALNSTALKMSPGPEIGPLGHPGERFHVQLISETLPPPRGNALDMSITVIKEYFQYGINDGVFVI